MTEEELFLNELNFHIRQGVSKKDLTGLINERLKQLTIPVVVEQSEQLECVVCYQPTNNSKDDEGKRYCKSCEDL